MALVSVTSGRNQGIIRVMDEGADMPRDQQRNVHGSIP